MVPDAVGVATEALQRGAAEIGYSETVYLDWTHDSPVPKVRIFTPAAEIAFAGHPLVGTAWLLRRLGPVKNVSEIEPPLGRLRCGADARRGWIECPLPHAGEVGDAAEALAAVGLDGRCGLVGLGQRYLMVEAPSDAAVAGVSPDLGRLSAAGGEVGVFHLDGASARMRFFAPRLGVDEDPATGSAAVALAGLLASDGRLPDRLEILQGDEVGRPSRLEVERSSDATVRLSGEVVFDGVRHIAL